MKNPKVLAAIAVLVFILALGLTVYPLVSTHYNARHESQIQTHYEEVLGEVDTSAIEAAWELAKTYNDMIRPGTKAEDAYSQEALRSASLTYDNQLNPTGNGIMGYINIPRISVDLPIYRGTDAETLDIGVGHLLGSSLPIGGDSTHSVLTAHSGMASRKLFSDLDKLAAGDIFYLKVLGETLAYQVDAIHKVLPHDSSYLKIEEGRDFCTLVTCTPFGVNTHRLLVRGRRVPYEEAQVVAQSLQEAEAPPASTWEQHYIAGILIGLGIVFVITVLYLLYRFRPRGKYEDAYSGFF